MKKTSLICILCSFLLLMPPSPVYAARLDYSSPDIIQAVQQALNDAGYQVGSPDGVIGEKTIQAIQSYRKDKELAASDKIDAKLFNSLMLSSKEKKCVKKVKKVIKKSLPKGDKVEEVTLWNRDLCICLDLAEQEGDFPLDAVAFHRVSAVTDPILEYEKYDSLWDTITVAFDFGESVVNGKDNLVENEYGRYFDSMNFHFESESESESENSGEGSTQANSSQGAQAQYEAFAQLVAPMLDTSYGGNYSIKSDSSGLTISVWMDGVAMGVAMASEGDPQMLSLYQDMKAGSQAAAQSFYESLTLVDPGAHLVYNVLNDLNLQYTMLSYYDGICFYDVLEA